MSITRKQAEILAEQLFPHANYLIRLRERATVTLSPTDPLYQDMMKAQDATATDC